MIDIMTHPGNAVHFENIPLELRREDQFFAWGYDDEGTKIPHRANGRGGLASSKNSATWCSYTNAVEYLKRSWANRPEVHRGLGFVFTKKDHFFGFDLDNCILPDGRIADWAQEILDRFATYVEFSPSGRGVKGFGVGSKPEGFKSSVKWIGPDGRESGVEVYDQGRYFAMTGRIVPGKPRDVLECQESLKWLCETYLKNEQETKPKATYKKPEKRHALDAHDERQAVISALHHISATRADNHNDWITIGMATHAYDPALLPEWEAWSMNSSKFKPGECAERWASFSRDGGATVATIFHFAKLDGWVRPIYQRNASPNASGGMFLDAGAYATPLGEFPGETVFNPEMLVREESGEQHNHSKACACEDCAREARTKEFQWQQLTKERHCSTQYFLTNGTKSFYARVKCRQWRCPSCRKKILVPKWQGHAKAITESHQSLYVGRVLRSDWKQVAREIRKQGGEYIRVLSVESDVLFVATAPFRGGLKTDRKTARNRLDFHLKMLRDFPPFYRAKQKMERPVTTSKNWRIPPDQRSKDFRRVNMPRTSESTVRKALAEYGVGMHAIDRDPNGHTIFARLELPENYFGNALEFLRSVALRITDIACPKEDRSQNPTAVSFAFQDSQDTEDFETSLSDYPQDPLWGSPTAA